MSLKVGWGGVGVEFKGGVEFRVGVLLFLSIRTIYNVYFQSVMGADGKLICDFTIFASGNKVSSNLQDGNFHLSYQRTFSIDHQQLFSGLQFPWFCLDGRNYLVLVGNWTCPFDGILKVNITHTVTQRYTILVVFSSGFSSSRTT